MSKHVCFNSERLSEGFTYIYSFKLMLSFLLLSVSSCFRNRNTDMENGYMDMPQGRGGQRGEWDKLGD